MKNNDTDHETADIDDVDDELLDDVRAVVEQNPEFGGFA